MHIETLNLINTNRLAFRGIENNKKRITAPYSTSDVFVKSKTNVQKTNLEPKKYTLDDVQKLYGNVFLDSLKL